MDYKDFCFEGKRHPWNMRVGICAPEILHWLRNCDDIRALLEDAKVTFQMKGAHVATEKDRKIRIAGAMKVGVATSSMNGLSLKHLVRSGRVRAWWAAFVATNRRALLEMEAHAKAAVRRSGPLGDNGQHFIDSLMENWFCCCAELTLTNAITEDEEVITYWEEDEHPDGGSSVFGMSLTLYGRRDLRCVQGEGLPDVIIPNEPGTVYCGQLTGPLHQVHHKPSLPGETLCIPRLGDLSMNVQMRCALFPRHMARLMKTTPNPPHVFNAMVKSFRESCSGVEWRLPDWRSCTRQHLIMDQVD